MVGFLRIRRNGVTMILPMEEPGAMTSGQQFQNLKICIEFFGEKLINVEYSPKKPRLPPDAAVVAIVQVVVAPGFP